MFLCCTDTNNGSNGGIDNKPPSYLEQCFLRAKTMMIHELLAFLELKDIAKVACLSKSLYNIVNCNKPMRATCTIVKKK